MDPVPGWGPHRRPRNAANFVMAAQLCGRSAKLLSGLDVDHAEVVFALTE